MGDHEDRESEGGLLAAEAIDETFVPVPTLGIASVELDGETVLAEADGGKVHCLDAVGTIVWACLDGSSSIDELSHELGRAFGVELEVVRRDILEFARQLGRAGLLEGVAAETPAHDHAHAPWAEPESLPLGTAFKPFELLALDGKLVSLQSFRGRSVLLVNWSPQCGYCRKIVPELASAQLALNSRNVDLVLVALGTAEENLALLQEMGLDCTLVLQQNALLEEFGGLGTPVAYLLDAEGTVASPLAVGADRVPTLAREAAGLGAEAQE